MAKKFNPNPSKPVPFVPAPAQAYHYMTDAELDEINRFFDPTLDQALVDDVAAEDAAYDDNYVTKTETASVLREFDGIGTLNDLWEDWKRTMTLIERGRPVDEEAKRRMEVLNAADTNVMFVFNRTSTPILVFKKEMGDGIVGLRNIPPTRLCMDLIDTRKYDAKTGKFSDSDKGVISTRNTLIRAIEGAAKITASDNFKIKGRDGTYSLNVTDIQVGESSFVVTNRKAVFKTAAGHVVVAPEQGWPLRLTNDKDFECLIDGAWTTLTVANDNGEDIALICTTAKTIRPKEGPRAHVGRIVGQMQKFFAFTDAAKSIVHKVPADRKYRIKSEDGKSWVLVSFNEKEQKLSVLRANEEGIAEAELVNEVVCTMNSPAFPSMFRLHMQDCRFSFAELPCDPLNLGSYNPLSLFDVRKVISKPAEFGHRAAIVVILSVDVTPSLWKLLECSEQSDVGNVIAKSRLMIDSGIDKSYLLDAINLLE